MLKSTPIIYLAIGIIGLLLCGSPSVRAQQAAGSWHGVLHVQGQHIPLVFHLEIVEEEWQGTMDSPAQGAVGIPLSEVVLTDAALIFSIAAAGIRYEGKFEDPNRITGRFFQGGMQLPLVLERSDDTQKATLNRPQEPLAPFPYLTEEVSFANSEANVQLMGTLTLPDGEGPWPAVVLLAGSGPHDRDQHVFGHKTLLVLADYLTRHGVATLRYDKRGVGESGGDYSTATSLDFADDAQSAWRYLRQHALVDADRVGLLGHSEGGMIAPMVAVKEPEVAFLVLLAAPGIRIDSLMDRQAYLIGKVSGMDEDQLAKARQANREIHHLIREVNDERSLANQLTQLLTEHAEVSQMPEENIGPLVDKQLQQLVSPWYRFFIQYDPQSALSAVRVPVLAINGDRDLQVTDIENLAGIRKALESAGNTQAATHSLPGLNHLLQNSETGAIAEYAVIEETIAPIVLQLVADWITENMM